MMAGEDGGAHSSHLACAFLWDPESKLYFHASSGFYHDPDAGWYYSSRDGLYYTFENGNYVLLESSNKSDGIEDHFARGPSPELSRTIAEDACSTKHIIYDGSENPPQPPSEWLEETLINLYLMGYPNPENNIGETMTTSEANREGSNDIFEAWNHKSNLETSFICHQSPQANNVEGNEQEPVPEEMPNTFDHKGEVTASDDSWDVETWQAQYGQIVLSHDEQFLPFSVIDLWDWSKITESGKDQVARLVGRLVRRSSKLHPSLPSGGGLLRTASVHEVSHDLVKVASGQLSWI